MKQIILIAVVVVAVITAPIGWWLATVYSGNEEALEAEIATLETRIAELEQKNQDLTIDLNALTFQVAGLQDNAVNQEEAERLMEEEDVDPGDVLADNFAQVVLISNRLNVNDGLTNSSSKYLIGHFGLPREVLGQQCESMTNPTLSNLVRTEDVGPIRVTMLQPAIDSLKRVFEQVRQYEPDLYDRIGSSGSLCVRNIRGTSGATPSTHAFGLSVDLNIDGQLDYFTDGKTQLGLILLADYFKREGWYWGAGFRREDSMHFQVSKEKIDEWLRNGEIKGR